ncbi:hypothetical protein AB0N07_29700 [Streptomyces sp. NPDC051172]|uniref:hypothetical protein n=1 Tax=Streptomyces sp. NPDC051172 TaxID=3155796 RepID=UPI00341AFD3B
MKIPRRGRVTGTMLFLAVLGMLAAAVPAALAAAPNPPPVPMQPGTPGAFALRWGDEDLRVSARKLRAAVNPNGAQVTVASMLNAANIPAQTQDNTGCRNQATGSGGALQGVDVEAFYCLRHDDAVDADWTPQGISGTEDAEPEDVPVDQRAIVFSWHEGPPGGSGMGTRLSFLKTANNKYIHVLLVVPNEAGTDYSEVALHAGGIAWYRNYIFVTANTGGLRVFDTTNLLQLAHNPKGSTSKTCKTGLDERSGRYCGRGYDYLLPEIGRWDNSNSTTTRYDSMSLERAPGRAPEFMTSEYRTNSVGQVVRWTDTALTSFQGTIHPFRAWFQPVRYVQGAFSRSCYYFNTGHSPSTGYLVAANATGNTKPVSQPGGQGLQDLYWLRSAEQLWTLTEYPGDGKRVLYGVSRPKCP